MYVITSYSIHYTKLYDFRQWNNKTKNNLKLGRRITSYNVCYTKLLREKNQWNELHATMYYEINSFDEYLDYIRKQPERDIRTTDFTLMSQMAPWSVKRLTHWFVTQNSDFNLQLESKLKYDEIRNNNIIFIGQFKTMSNSKSLFLKNSKVFKTYLDGFKYNDGKSEKIYNTRYDRKGKIEYAMVSFTSLSPNTSAFYFVSNRNNFV